MENIFKFGGKDVAVNPLNVKQLKELKADMSKAKHFGPFAEEKDEDEGVFDAVVKVVKAAVSDPGITEDDIASGVNLGNFGDIWSALLGLPVKRIAPGEAPAGQAAA